MSKRKKGRRTGGGTKRASRGRGVTRRALWKGAVSFGLVHIPVEMHAASRESTLDLDLLDSRDFSPVGYRRYNKRTGKTVPWERIVKGYEYRKGQYVALTDEDFRQANVEASQTIDLSSFADRSSIPPEYYEAPYYLAPAEGGERAYALLREAMQGSDKAAVGSFVIRGRQHFCAIFARGRALLLNTLRFAEEIRSTEGLDLPPAVAKSAGISGQEVSMARRLIQEMTGAWRPEAFRDDYRRDLMRRIRAKIRKHQTHALTPPEEIEEARPSAEVIDLTAMLRKSLRQRGGARGRRKAA